MIKIEIVIVNLSQIYQYKMKNEQIVVMNMCGRGDKDIFTVANELNINIS